MGRLKGLTADGQRRAETGQRRQRLVAAGSKRGECEGNPFPQQIL